ncbi:Alpha-N-acetylglucosaminidase [Glycine soja]|uniref:Alpha-N-acetylglucosaminidase n=2 Tax=Glycine soja TaxID=3848 RepID=A0A445KBN6_GLYSO|nr:Alpha-N-acetylglucosaminidase [Glycine soja]RZC08205.1 Alpha-N-acetylglucosaminidase [Glycine soja]
MSMEGIEQNPIVYDLMSEMAFQHKKVDVKAWVDMYSTRRYGQTLPLIQEGWNVLYHTIYNCTDGAYDKNRDVIVAFPDVDPSLISVQHEQSHHNDKPYSGTIIKEITDSFDQPHLWYPTSEVIYALELFITSGDELSRCNTYRYDLVDLTRQVLAKYANELFFKVIEAYQSRDIHGMTLLSQRFLDLVEDLDTLLACHDGFLLGPWLESAKQLALNEEQERQFEWNARTQITMWFDNSDEEASLLRDYGNKYWNGLLHDYYGPRAAIYFKYLRESLESGEDFKLRGWRREWIKLTNEWQKRRNIFPVESSGDALNTSRWLFNKYLNLSNPETKLVLELN